MNVTGLTLNYRDHIRTFACVSELLKQGVSHVIVWDNSGDGGISAKCLQAHFMNDSRVEIVVSQSNLGFSAGVNRGLDLLRRRDPCCSVLLINNDARLLDDGLRILSDVLTQCPESHLIYPCINHGGWVRGTVHYQRWTGLLSDHKLPGTFPYPSGCCLLINLSRIGARLFDEDFFMYGEDMELGHRLHKIAGAMQHVPKVLVFHEGSASSGMGTEFYETRMIAAHWKLAGKLQRSRLDRALLITGRLLALPARAILRTIRYGTFIPLRSLLQGIRIAQERRSPNQGAE